MVVAGRRVQSRAGVTKKERRCAVLWAGVGYTALEWFVRLDERWTGRMAGASMEA